MRPTGRWSRWLVVIALALVGAGCGGATNRGHQVERFYTSPYHEPRTVALTVFLNQSGAKSLDMLALTDAFYAELQMIPTLQVVPVNRTLSSMRTLRVAEISTGSEAMELAELLDADGIIVGSVTKYDPYHPPHIGLALQYYDRHSRLAKHGAATNPVVLSRSGTPFGMPPIEGTAPTVTVVRIIDSDEDEVQERIKAYAAHRSGRASPAGWRKYMLSQPFLRFASHEMIGELLAMEWRRLHSAYEGPEGPMDQSGPALVDPQGDI